MLVLPAFVQVLEVEAVAGQAKKFSLVVVVVGEGVVAV